MTAFGRGSDPVYFDLLERAAGNAERTAELLKTLIADYPERADLAREILLCEQEGDGLTHSIIQRLGGGSKPPYARAELHTLASALDDVVDWTEQVADSFGLYKIEAPMDQAGALAEVLFQSCTALVGAVAELRNGGGKALAAHLVEIHRLENEGDRLSRAAIASLFAGGIDPMVVIRWKDIFEQLEQAIDACETAAHLLEGLTI